MQQSPPQHGLWLWHSGKDETHCILTRNHEIKKTNKKKTIPIYKKHFSSITASQQAVFFFCIYFPQHSAYATTTTLITMTVSIIDHES